MQNPQDSKRIGQTCRWTVAKWLIVLAAALVLASLVAQPVFAAEVKKPQTETAAPANASEKAGLYDIDATGTDIKYVVEALAKSSGANIIVSPDITSQVTAHLKQMSVDDILDCLSTVQGFAWEKSGGTYMLMGKDAAAQTAAIAAQAEVEEVEPQLLVWQCKHIKPAEAATTLQSVFPKLKVVAGPCPSTPILSQQSGALPNSFSAGTASSSQTSTTSAPGTTVLIYGDPADVARAGEALTQMDKPRQQVAIRVAVTELTNNASKALGMDWTYSDVGISENGPDTGDGVQHQGIRFGSFARDGMSFTGTISALIKNGSGKLLAEPNVSVIDGESASILIGERILFPKLIGYNQIGAPMYDKEEERVGIYLQIAPQVTSNDEVLLTLYPQVSLVTGYLKTGETEYPQISTREARTTVRVKSGSTLSIGGLLRDNDIKDATKVPLLGDLPIIGQFFKRNKTTREHTEIVILLTPIILADQ